MYLVMLAMLLYESPHRPENMVNLNNAVLNKHAVRKGPVRGEQVTWQATL